MPHHGSLTGHPVLTHIHHRAEPRPEKGNHDWKWGEVNMPQGTDRHGSQEQNQTAHTQNNAPPRGGRIQHGECNAKGKDCSYSVDDRHGSYKGLGINKNNCEELPQPHISQFEHTKPLQRNSKHHAHSPVEDTRARHSPRRERLRCVMMTSHGSVDVFELALQGIKYHPHSFCHHQFHLHDQVYPPPPCRTARCTH